MKLPFFDTQLEIKDIVAADDLAKPMIDYMIGHLIDHMIE